MGPLANIAFDFTSSDEKDHHFVASTAVLFWGMYESVLRIHNAVTC